MFVINITVLISVKQVLERVKRGKLRNLIDAKLIPLIMGRKLVSLS